jgi:Family of unknown function (DUF5681)
MKKRNLNPKVPGNYEVGYCRTPEATRFKPGQSGNLKGRPKGRTNKRLVLSEEGLKSIILSEAYRDIKVSDGEKQITIPMVQAVMRSLGVTAAKGNTRAQKLFTELLAATERSDKQRRDEWLETAVNYKTGWEMELERLRIHGIKPPDLIPHPDDIIVDFRLGTVEIRGPMSREELKDLKEWLSRRNAHKQELERLHQELRDLEDEDFRPMVQDDIDRTRENLAIIDRAIALRASKECVERLEASV